MSETTKQPTKKEQQDERINKIVKVSKELEILINQSVTNPDIKAKISPLIKELNDLCEAQATILRLARMIYFYKYLKPEQKNQYTRGLIGALRKVIIDPEPES